MLLQEKLRPYRLLLASHSPRRRQLLRDCGLEYTLLDQYEVEERYPAELPPHDVPLYLSQLKSDACPRPLAEGDILLTADTVVVAGGGDPRQAARPRRGHGDAPAACRGPNISSPQA